MTDPTTAPALNEADYEALEAALGANARGRAFLAEVARRGRSQELAAVLAAVEALAGRPPHPEEADGLRALVGDLAGAVDRAANHMRAADPAGIVRPLGDRLHDQQAAMSQVLDAAERIQEAAWTLREQGVDGTLCDALDERATDIYAACSRQEAESRIAAIALAAYDFIAERVQGASPTRLASPPAALLAPLSERGEPAGALTMASTPLLDDIAFVLPREPARDEATAGDVNDRELAPPDGGLSIEEAFAEIDRLPTREKLALFS